MAIIQLKAGPVVLIDDEDADLVGICKWHLFDGNGGFYVRGKVNGRFVLMHRFLLSISDPDVRVDHRNGNGLDNRRSNLRLANASQNAANSGKRSLKRPYKGVYRNGAGWSSSITVNRKQWHLGTYKTPEQAAVAYDLTAVQVYGEFAKCNLS